MERNQLPPPPTEDSLRMLKELGTYVATRHPMSPDSKDRLGNAIGDQQTKIKLILAAVGAHKMRGIHKILAAIDLCKAKMMDPGYISDVTAEGPHELRKHTELLCKMQEYDLQFLASMTSELAEKKGFSRDPGQQLEHFLGSSVSAATLPEDITIDGRRKVARMIEGLLALAEGKVPAIPQKEHRVIDVEAEHSDDNSGGAQQAGPGTANP